LCFVKQVRLLVYLCWEKLLPRASWLSLAGLWDRPVTWELKNIPPLAAVENIGQWTKVWTSASRKMKNL